jgi:two-component system sensor histidine kinase CiaH
MKLPHLKIAFWFLTMLTLCQVLWWAYLLNYHHAMLIKLNPTLLGLQDYASFKRMILFESSFFLLVWLACLYFSYRAYQKEMQLQRAHNSFFAAISHELKTPLAVIRLSLDTLARPTIDSDKKGIYIDRANIATDRLLKEVETILQFTSIASLQTATQNISLNHLVKECVNQIEALRTTNLEIDVDLKQDFMIKTSPFESKLVLKNILENAAKYSTANNKSGKIKITAEKMAKKVSLIIKDNGIGMTKDELRSAFEPFWRSERVIKDAKPGTGMGLSLAQQLSKKAGLQILLESDGLNRGTTTRLLWEKEFS